VIPASTSGTREAAGAIEEFTRGKAYQDYAASRLLRAAVERQFEIIGEALSQLAKVDPALAGRARHLPRIVAFRNILIHGYAVIDDATVWRAVEENLPALRGDLDALLGEPGGESA
jgi:uncharacterized protein with HEPN domain